MAEKGAGNGVTGTGALTGLVVLAVALLGGLLWYTQRPAPEISEDAAEAQPESAPAPLAALPEASTVPEPSVPAAEPAQPAMLESDVAAAEPVAEAPSITEETAAPSATDLPEGDSPAEAAPAEPAPPQPPVFSTVRITPQGEALVAGQAEPGAEVSVMVDGAATVQARANDRGDFVAMFDLPPSDAPRILSLSQTSGGVALGSTETVVLEPIAPPPAVVADAAPVDPAVPAEPVAEPAAPTAILLSDSGARVLQSANALPGGSVSIAAITYTPDGGVQLSGLGAPGATVRLYLNNALRGEAVVTESGAWVSTLRGVLPGLYSLRADQVDGAGAVTSRFETPFQRESLEALAAVMKPQAVVAGPASAPPLTDAGVPAPPPAAALAVPDGPVNITVQPGFTLWQIARERFGDGVLYVKVYDANRDQIRDPDLIYPGQVFTIPGQ